MHWTPIRWNKTKETENKAGGCLVTKIYYNIFFPKRLVQKCSVYKYKLVKIFDIFCAV